MKKIIITLTTDASFLTVNKMQNKLLSELLTGNFSIGEYTIQEAKADPAVFSSLDNLIKTDQG